MHFHKQIVTPLYLSLVCLSFTMGGCNSGSTAPPPPASLLVDGRLERGLTVSVKMIVGNDTIDANDASLTFTPSSAATLQSDGSVKLNAAGLLTIAGENSVGREASTQITVAVPPTIVFERVVGGVRGIYRAALDGGDLTSLTSQSSVNREPSAASSLVLFTSYRDRHAQIYSVPLAGGPETRVTTSSYNTTSPALSTDGTRIAYAIDSGGLPRIRTSTLSGVNVQSITTFNATSAVIESSPRWDPVNLRLVFTSTAFGTSRLMLAAPGGNAAPVFASSTFIEVEPAWSANGQSIVFVTDRAGPTEIYTVKLSDLQVQRITTRGNVGQPTWLLDGRIVFVTQTGSTTRMHWVDPAKLGQVVDIPIDGNPLRPQEVR